MILTVSNLSVTYSSPEGYVHALNGVSFEVRRHEILGLVGESGCGKSTFASALLGLLPSDARVEGEVLFEKNNILLLDEKQKQNLRANKISLIFQEPASSFNPVLSIGYQFDEFLRCRFPASLDKTKRQKLIADSLAKVHLPETEHVLKSYPHQLSGGQLQRVAIAMAIALRPALLIADEPTSSLDVTIESQIIHLFQELQKNLGLTIIFITHNLDLIRVLCERVVVLYRGMVKEIEFTANLFGRPHDSYTQQLLNSFKQLEE